MDNPYHSPTKAVGPQLMEPFRWKRIFVWAVLIYAAANAVGFLSGLSLAYWRIYGQTFEEAVENGRTVMRISAWIVYVILYWRMAAPVQNRLLHVVAVFVTIQLLDLMEAFFLYRVPAKDLINAWGFARQLLAAAVGLGLASWSSRNSFQPKPLRCSS